MFEAMSDLARQYLEAIAMRLSSVLLISFIHVISFCNFIPQWTASMNMTWTRDNVLNQCKHFYINPYLHHSDFVLFRYIPRINR
jgi:hypothetical protein